MKIVVLFLALITLAIGKEKHGRWKSAHPHKTHENRINGGSNANRGQIPYIVSVQWGDTKTFQHICAGSIIGRTTILTAGHCVTITTAYAAMRIRAGILNMNDENSVGQTIAVASTFVHPDYQREPGPNDLAVLQLATPLNYTDAIRPIGLPILDSVATGQAVLSGWGSLTPPTMVDMPNRLQTVTVEIITPAECATAVANITISSEPLSSTNICTGPLTGGTSACLGDSGDPLAQNNTVIGVVSWGFVPCGLVSGPSIYVEVSKYITWINSKIN